MKKLTRIFFLILKICGITVLSLLLLLFLAPYFFPQTVSRQIKDWTNQSIQGDLDFSRARLSFFTHFPSLTLTLYDVHLRGSAPFEKDTLLNAAKLGFGVNLKKFFFDHQVSINKIFLTSADIRIQVNTKGEANYNIYRSDSGSKATDTTSAASLHLEKIKIKDSRLFYNDESVPMLIEAEHLYYEGTGDISQSIFDLDSHLRTDSLNFTLNNLSYVSRKALDANLITHINTKTLSLRFENNRIKINKLNVAFAGKLDFLKNGYDIDLSLVTQNADLYQLITSFPPSYVEWLGKSRVSGIVGLQTSLKGKYIVSQHLMPDFHLDMLLNNGSIAYDKSRIALNGLNLNAKVDLPGLDPEKLHVKLDSFSFRLEKDYFRAAGEISGLHEPEVHLKAYAGMDLRTLQDVTGIRDPEMSGRIILHADVHGRYARKVVKVSPRKSDTVIASIPRFDIQASLQQGLVRFQQNKEPLRNIFLQMHAECADGNYRHAYIKIDTIHAEALKNFVEGKAILHASTDFPFDLSLKGILDLSDIRSVYPLDSLDLAGKVRFDFQSRGKYAPEHHLFPKTRAHFVLDGGYLRTKYYPHPIEKVRLDLLATDEAADLKSLQVNIKPASLVFEGKEFTVESTLENFDDLRYDLSVRGELDLGKIYRVFARRDMDLNGFLGIHASFKGTQSDAIQGNYDQLRGSGTMELKDLTLTSELFPKPFLLQEGRFRFSREKMWFTNFKAVYGHTDLQMDGFADNVINYWLGKNTILRAGFDLKSRLIDIDEFSFYGENASPSGTVSRAAGTGTAIRPDSSTGAAGVVVLPADLDLTIRADLEQIRYGGIRLNHFQGGLNLRKSELELTETGFEMIGCQVSMNGKYNSISPVRAAFDYHLQAKDFDVHRAWEEIRLFHDLAQSAQYAYGVVSIDYTLTGKLNEQLAPVYPSLKGGGTLTVKNVKCKGWKLFNTVGSEAGKSEMKDPDLSKIDIKSTIKNNLITIERVKFKTGPLRIRLEGQTSFDNKVNFKMRIGLPPLGIIGIPVRITGDMDNPKIKLGKQDSDPLQEKEEEQIN